MTWFSLMEDCLFMAKEADAVTPQPEPNTEASTASDSAMSSEEVIVLNLITPSCPSTLWVPSFNKEEMNGDPINLEVATS